MATSVDFIVKSGLSVATSATIHSTVAAISTTTGALIVAGGAGIGGTLYAESIYSNGIQLLGQVSQSFTAVEGQSTFTTSNPITPGTEQVFANGIQLIAGDYTVTDSTITLGTPRRADDSIRIIAGQIYSQFSPVGMVIATPPQSAVNFDVMTQSMQYYTAASTTNFKLNIRSNASTSLNSTMSVGQTVNVILRITNGTVAHYPNEYQIDGTTVVPRWKVGTSGAVGTANAVDEYTISVIKIGVSAYNVFATRTSFQ